MRTNELARAGAAGALPGRVPGTSPMRLPVRPCMRSASMMLQPPCSVGSSVGVKGPAWPPGASFLGVLQGWGRWGDLTAPRGWALLRARVTGEEAAGRRVTRHFCCQLPGVEAFPCSKHQDVFGRLLAAAGGNVPQMPPPRNSVWHGGGRGHR